MNLLIVGPSWVGDIVMAQSLFKQLQSFHSNGPEREKVLAIDVLAPDWSQSLLERMPEVRSVIPVSLQHGSLNLSHRFQIVKSLNQKYDQAIVLTNSWKSALIPWLAKIPKRTGWLGEMRFGLLNDIRKFRRDEFPRMVDRFVMLAHPQNTPLAAFVNKIDPPKLRIRKESVENVLSKFSINVPEQPILALCPGAEFGPSKRWPEEYYAAVAKRKLEEGYAVWIFGSKKDKPVAEKIKTLCLKGCKSEQCLDFTGETTLGEAIDLLSLAKTVVSNDSGLMHIAAALEKPLVAVYGSTDPKFTPPLHALAKILRVSDLACSPCFKRECPLKHHQCMRALSVDKVLEQLNIVNTLEQPCPPS